MPLKRGHGEEHENHERWLVSYADFITLLFAFFTVLYATSQQDAEKAKKFEESIRKYLSGLTAPGGGPGGGGVGTTRASMEQPVQALPDPRGSVNAVEAAVAEYLEKNMSKEDRSSTVAEVSADERGVRLKLTAKAVFAAGSPMISKDGLESLIKMAKMIKELGRHVVVEGHAFDEISSNPTLTSPWEISSMRATKVARILVERLGVPPAQISAQGYADKHPLPGVSDSSKNRRVEFYFLTKESE
jgi:chemotaxis protein MotB